MFELLNPQWASLLNTELKKEYIVNLNKFVEQAYKENSVYPPKRLLFKAFDYFSPAETKVVILGQDPYHEPNQAHGLCFSVPIGIKIPPSLVNIYKEINTDCGKPIPTNGNLEHWAKQGILLLNATLTVEAHKAGSHQKRGWEQFTDSIIRLLSDSQKNIVFILWGSYAKQKEQLIDSSKHLVLKATHPSPLSVYRGFWGCKHFSKTNEYLLANNKSAIEW